jgi:phenylacetate-CoA ligase
MNPFLNPINTFSFLKNYFSDISRLNKLGPEEIKKYKDKSFKKIVKYAYTVPLYHDKYKKAGIHPDDIKGIDDIKKLPMISKNDLRDNFPDKILPVGYKKENAQVICSGGTTGKPVYVFYDFEIATRSTPLGVRIYKYLNLNWRKSRFVYVGELSENRAGKVYDKNFLSHVRTFLSLNNVMEIDINKPMKEIIQQLDVLQPDSIHSYPTVFQYLAYLKTKGYGKNLKPKILSSTGTRLDDYTKTYVENAFGCPVLNLYASIEAGGSIAFECLHRKWHINYDFFEIEAVDRNGELVSPGEKGQIVVTRLFGKGTPIIRYTGMEDWVSISEDEECECGLQTPIFKNGVEGRIRNDIILPNGKIFSAATFCAITPITQQLKTYKIKQYQIIQKKIDEIDILIVIDDDLRDVGPSVDLIIAKISKVYQDIVGHDVKINVKEVKDIKSIVTTGPRTPIVISYVTPEDAYKIINK